MWETPKLKYGNAEVSSFGKRENLTLSATQVFIGGGVPTPGVQTAREMHTFDRPTPPGIQEASAICTLDH